MKADNSSEKVYTAPELTVYGDVERITKGNSSGDALDQTFEVGTFADDLTFS